MDRTTIRAKVSKLASQRETLVQLLEQPDLGTLRLDVNQALEELDELIEDCEQAFPEVSA